MTPYYTDDGFTLYAGDCLEVMPMLEPSSIDAIVTDPPYGIGFMGHAWDQPGRFGSQRRDGSQQNRRRGHRNTDGTFVDEGALMAGSYDQSPAARRAYQDFCEAWGREVFQLARPGAWLLSFGSPRAHHRQAVGLEEAGWELFDEIEWLFAQGMPKGRTTLKPAHEPILMARKPAARVTPLQIDEARIPFAGDQDLAATNGKNPGRDGETVTSSVYGADRPQQLVNQAGRWPANVVLTDPVLERGAESVIQSRAETARGHVPARRPASLFQANEQPETNGERRLDVGSYSRYFLIPKTGRRERNAGLEDVDEQPMLWSSGTKSPGTFQSPNTKRAARTHHPTIKPIELMAHLVRLVTPPGGVCLDPFLGSGTTAIAAVATGRRCIGIERDSSYLPLAPRRLRLLRRQAVAS